MEEGIIPVNGNLISVSPDIRQTEVLIMNEEEEMALRGSEAVNHSVTAVRNGCESMKTRNYYRLPNCCLPEGETKGTRNNSGKEDNNKVMIDFDEHDGFAKLWSKVGYRVNELGILHFEVSAHYGAHMTVRQIEGLDKLQTILWFEKELGMSFDHVHDLSRACFLVTEDDVLYVHPDYYLRKVEPQVQDINEFLASTPQFATTTTSQKLVVHRSTVSTRGIDCSGYSSTYDDNKEEMLYIIYNNIVMQKLDITAYEPDWFALGVAIYNVLGEADGRKAYHDVSKFYPNYSAAETDSYFDRIACNSYPNNMGTFIRICCQGGVFNNNNSEENGKIL